MGELEKCQECYNKGYKKGLLDGYEQGYDIGLDHGEQMALERIKNKQKEIK